MKKQTIAGKINGMKKMSISFATLAAVVMAIGLASFTSEKNKHWASIRLAFDGDPTNQTQVNDESRWKEITPTFTCNADEKACTMYVPDVNLTGSSPRYLDNSKVTISSTPTLTGFVPDLVSGIDSVQNRP